MSGLNDSGEQPVPVAWRQAFRLIVAAFVAGDYRLAAGVPGVAPISVETAARIQRCIEDYGATLVALPEETWNSSVCAWTGSHWETLIDLWTQEEGRSDMVLHARVTEASELLVEVHLVYVP